MKRFNMLNFLLIFLFFTVLFVGCDDREKSDSGVHKASVQVNTDASGLTVEQNNVANRLTNDNKIGAIKYLYVISPYSGQVILFSSVKGKVTSSGKRLTPSTVIGDNSKSASDNRVNINKTTYLTNEVLQDDGTYGTSDPYIYWWDAKGIYHQHFMTGGQIVHVADQPITVKNVIISID